MVNTGAGHWVYSVGVKSLTNQERERLRAAIDDNIIMQSIDFDPYHLPKVVISKGCEQKHLDAFAALCTKGCAPPYVDVVFEVGACCAWKVGSVPSLRQGSKSGG